MEGKPREQDFGCEPVCGQCMGLCSQSHQGTCGKSIGRKGLVRYLPSKNCRGMEVHIPWTALNVSSSSSPAGIRAQGTGTARTHVAAVARCWATQSLLQIRDFLLGLRVTQRPGDKDMPLKSRLNRCVHVLWPCLLLKADLSACSWKNGAVGSLLKL